MSHLLLIRNLLFQPVTLNTANGSIHLLSRRACSLPESELSAEIQLAESRGFVRITTDLKPPSSSQGTTTSTPKRRSKRTAKRSEA